MCYHVCLSVCVCLCLCVVSLTRACLWQSKEESKASLKDKLKQVQEGMEEMEDSVVKQLVDSAAREDYEGALAQSLVAFTALVYARFDGGQAQFPLQKNPATGQFTQAEFESLEMVFEVNVSRSARAYVCSC